jgi:hypothetical protein
VLCGGWVIGLATITRLDNITDRTDWRGAEERAALKPFNERRTNERRTRLALRRYSGRKYSRIGWLLHGLSLSSK